MLLLQPLAYYIAYGWSISFWSFYLLYLHGVGSIADGPIWFVELLLYFSLLYAAWRWPARLRTPPARGEGAVPGYWAIFGFILALGLLSFVVRIWWPLYNYYRPLNLPLGYLLQYVCFFVLGIVAYRSNWLFKLTPRMGRNWALIALLTTLPFYGVVIPYAFGGGNGRGAGRRVGRWSPLALPRLHAVGVVRDRGGLHRVAGALPRALQSSGEAGERPGRQCVHGLPDPSGGAGRVCLRLQRGGALCPAQMGHRGARHAPVVFPAQ